MSLRHALLGALADRPRTGYELLKHFEQSLAYAWPARHSRSGLSREVRAPAWRSTASEPETVGR